MIGCQIMTKPTWGIVYNVFQNPVSLFCTMWLIMTKPARLGCCVQCIPEPSQPENFGHFCEFMAKVFKYLISYTAV